MRCYRPFFLILTATLLLTNAAGQESFPDKEQYRLVWSEDFDTDTLDTTLWSMVPQQPYDWARHMTSDYPHLIELSDGTLKLRADYDRESGRYITAGIWGKGKQEITGGWIDVRARYDSGQGFWPAIWMLGYAPDKRWPHNGEIDIMEHLNHDSIVYQTVHTPLTEQEGYAGPPKGGVIEVDTSGFNVYSTVITSGAIYLLVNGQLCHTFPRLGDEVKQYPYATYPLYLILSAQIGGSWVGEPVPPQEPLTLEIDYIRHYLPEK